MAQTMMAITLLKPNSARARPSTLINSDAEYKRIFSLDIQIDIYLKAIQIMKAVENYLKHENCGQQLEYKTVINIKYYVAMMVCVKLVGSKEGIVDKLAQIPAISIPAEVLQESLDLVLKEFNVLGATDQIAKGSAFVGKLLS